jgi:hypothetical protein
MDLIGIGAAPQRGFCALDEAASMPVTLPAARPRRRVGTDAGLSRSQSEPVSTRIVNKNKAFGELFARSGSCRAAPLSDENAVTEADRRSAMQRHAAPCSDLRGLKLVHQARPMHAV